MANFDTSTYTAQTTRETSLHVDVSARSIQSKLRIAEFEYSTLAGLQSGDKLRLGFLKAKNARIVPELCRLSSLDGTGVSVLLTLKKVDSAGTETELCAQATLANNSVALARPSGIEVPLVGEDDYLMLLAGTVTTATAGKRMRAQIAFYAEESP